MPVCGPRIPSERNLRRVPGHPNEADLLPLPAARLDLQPSREELERAFRRPLEPNRTRVHPLWLTSVRLPGRRGLIRGERCGPAHIGRRRSCRRRMRCAGSLGRLVCTPRRRRDGIASRARDRTWPGRRRSTGSSEWGCVRTGRRPSSAFPRGRGCVPRRSRPGGRFAGLACARLTAGAGIRSRAGGGGRQVRFSPRRFGGRACGGRRRRRGRSSTGRALARRHRR